jgi:hypothetical protein
MLLLHAMVIVKMTHTSQYAHSACVWMGKALAKKRLSAMMDQLEPGEEDSRAEQCAVTTNLDVTLARDDYRHRKPV